MNKMDWFKRGMITLDKLQTRPSDTETMAYNTLMLDNPDRFRDYVATVKKASLELQALLEELEDLD